MSNKERESMSGAMTLSTRFRISIPKDACRSLGWQPGQRLAFLPKGGSVLIVPVPNRDSLAGIAKGADTSNYRDRNDRY